ncbi:Replication factor C subunit 1 [Smittium mucronatum]|uniref:Replication factor C subunit 1 n=1 Tax=Smittium mucronatum TaxID=133383 RepID=A0A1R0GU98_9FUNG|nr:Replication factor C subunit 1 [Smittium mucronatum]
MYQEFPDSSEAPKKPRKSAAGKKSTITSSIVTDAIKAGVNVVMGNTLESIEKSKYKPWEAKAPSGGSGENSRDIPIGSPGCFDGVTFVITGELPSFSRDTCSDIIKRYGGRITGAVSSKTTFLIIGEEPGSSKVNKAKQFNTPTLDEDSFVALVGMFNTSSQSSGNPEVQSVNTQNPLQNEPAIEEIVMREADNEKKTNSIISENIVPKYDVPKPSISETKIKNVSQDTNPSPKKNPNSSKSKKAILISGPPGIGKTSSVQLIAKELGMNCLEFNASDSRNKESIKNHLGVLSGNRSMTEFLTLKTTNKDASIVRSGKTVVVMDEVDGMSGGDRGGATELIKIISDTKVPIICICNDRMSQKIRSLANHCEDIRFKRPGYAQFRSRIMSICHREGLKIDPAAADQLSTATQSDMRQVLNILSTWKLSRDSMTYDEGKKFSTINKKEVTVGPFEVIGRYLNSGSYRDMSFSEKINLYFNDFSLIPLMIQENYIENSSAQAKNINAPPGVGDLMMLSKAADSIAEGDLIGTIIQNSQSWGLLPNHAVMSSVRPSFFMTGRHMSMYTFPGWLGKNSSTQKNQRLLSDLSSHMRNVISGDKTQVRMSYVQPLSMSLTAPLIENGINGIDNVLEIMKIYNLTRDDWDTIQDIQIVPKGVKTPASKIETKVKSAFTRQYNKEYSDGLTKSKSAPKRKLDQEKIKPDLEDVVDDDDDVIDDDGDDGNDSSDSAKDKKPKIDELDDIIVITKSSKSSKGSTSKKASAKKPAARNTRKK